VFLCERLHSVGGDMEKELRAIVAQLEDCWNRFDSKCNASVFAEDVDFIHILGAYYHGRESVEKGHRIIFDTIYKGSHNKMEIQKIRPVGEDVAVVFVESTLNFFQNGTEVTIKSRPTLVASRRQGGWEIVAFQNTLQKEAVSDEALERLVRAHPFPGSGPAQP
jgi:uncharacterized protein (TIGR02246 family)